MSLRRIARFAFAVAGAALGGERLAGAWSCYHRMQEAVHLGDLSGAEGWRTFMTVDLAAAFLVAGATWALSFSLRPRRGISK